MHRSRKHWFHMLRWRGNRSLGALVGAEAGAAAQREPRKGHQKQTQDQELPRKYDVHCQRIATGCPYATSLEQFQRDRATFRNFVDWLKQLRTERLERLRRTEAGDEEQPDPGEEDANQPDTEPTPGPKGKRPPKGKQIAKKAAKGATKGTNKDEAKTKTKAKTKATSKPETKSPSKPKPETKPAPAPPQPSPSPSPSPHPDLTPPVKSLRERGRRRPGLRSGAVPERLATTTAAAAAVAVPPPPPRKRVRSTSGPRDKPVVPAKCRRKGARGLFSGEKRG